MQQRPTSVGCRDCLGRPPISVLTEVLPSLPYSPKNLIGLPTGDKLDVPGASLRKPAQPKKLNAAHFMALRVHCSTPNSMNRTKSLCPNTIIDALNQGGKLQRLVQD